MTCNEGNTFSFLSLWYLYTISGMPTKHQWWAVTSSLLFNLQAKEVKFMQHAECCKSLQQKCDRTQHTVRTNVRM